MWKARTGRELKGLIQDSESVAIATAVRITRGIYEGGAAAKWCEVAR